MLAERKNRKIPECPNGQLVRAEVLVSYEYCPIHGLDYTYSPAVSYTRHEDNLYLDLDIEIKDEPYTNIRLTERYVVGTKATWHQSGYVEPPEVLQIINSAHNLLPADFSRFAKSIRHIGSENFEEYANQINEQLIVIEIGTRNSRHFVRTIVEPDDPHYVHVMDIRCEAGTGVNGRHKPKLPKPKTRSHALKKPRIVIEKDRALTSR